MIYIYNEKTKKKSQKKNAENNVERTGAQQQQQNVGKRGNTRNYQHQHKHKQSARRIYNGKVNKLTSRARLLSR